VSSCDDLGNAEHDPHHDSDAHDHSGCNFAAFSACLHAARCKQVPVHIMPSTRVLRGDTLLLLPAVTTTPRLTTTAAPTTTPRATTTAAPSTTPTTTPGANDMLLTTALFDSTCWEHVCVWSSFFLG